MWIQVVISIFSHIVAIKVRCTEECPLFVDDFLTTGTICDFACVGDSIQSCKERNPVKTVADPETGVRRRCIVVGCLKCRSDGTERCENCLEGYPLIGNGRCVYTWGYETQNRLMYVKVGFLLFAYVFSFVGAILLDIRQWSSLSRTRASRTRTSVL